MCHQGPCHRSCTHTWRVYTIFFRMKKKLHKIFFYKTKIPCQESIKNLKKNGHQGPYEKSYAHIREKVRKTPNSTFILRWCPPHFTGVSTVLGDGRCCVESGSARTLLILIIMLVILLWIILVLTLFVWRRSCAGLRRMVWTVRSWRCLVRWICRPGYRTNTK